MGVAEKQPEPINFEQAIHTRATNVDSFWAFFGEMVATFGKLGKVIKPLMGILAIVGRSRKLASLAGLLTGDDVAGLLTGEEPTNDVLQTAEVSAEEVEAPAASPEEAQSRGA